MNIWDKIKKMILPFNKQLGGKEILQATNSNQRTTKTNNGDDFDAETR